MVQTVRSHRNDSGTKVPHSNRKLDPMNPAVKKARDFALAAHGDQPYGTQPYVYHLDAVADILAPFGDVAQIVGYLHDTVEDTEITIAVIHEEFGTEVADCVALLTDEEGVDRGERKAKTNAKLAATSNSLALIVKAADRLANLRESVRDPVGGKLDMYLQEHAAFKNAVYRSGICDDLWVSIDNIIEPP